MDIASFILKLSDAMGCQAEHRTDKNPWIAVFLVIKGSGVARGRVGTTMRKRNLVAILPVNRSTKTGNLGFQRFSLILDIHALGKWHIAKQGIHWLVSLDHIASSSIKLLKVTCFFVDDRCLVTVLFLCEKQAQTQQPSVIRSSQFGVG